MSDFTQKRSDLASKYICDLDLLGTEYIVWSWCRSFFSLLTGKYVRVSGAKGNQVLFKPGMGRSKIDIKFASSVNNSRVYIGDSFTGKLRLRINASNCMLYIGNKVQLGGVLVDMYQEGTQAFIGNGVTTGPECAFYCDEASSGFIMGDDCMLSRAISLRSTDGHPIWDSTGERRINCAENIISIQPHVWLGEGVTVLKEVTIGTGSIVGANSTVVKDVPPYSAVAGVPAEVRNKRPVMWSRSESKEDKQAMRHYEKLYPIESD